MTVSESDYMSEIMIQPDNVTFISRTIFDFDKIPFNGFYILKTFYAFKLKIQIESSIDRHFLYPFLGAYNKNGIRVKF